MAATARILVVWCPDWPVTAAGAPPTSPVAVLHTGSVVACSAAARAEGVRRGQRRREAQLCCPQLELIPHDPARDARAFEPVLLAVESLAPKVEVLQPGECAIHARGPARYHGGEATLAVMVASAVDQVLGAAPGCRIGIADGRFAAGIAARHSLTLQHSSGPSGGRGSIVDRHVIVPAGEAAGFLAPFPVKVLERPELTDMLVRLGVTTLGHVAALPRTALAARFGLEGIRAHRLASGMDEHPRASRRPPPDLRVAVELEPPASRVDVAAFAAKALADELVEHLERLGLACTRLRIEAETEHGETLTRVWRHEASPRASSRRDAANDSRALQAVAMAEHVRWQLDGWLAGAAALRPTGAITHLALAPDEVVPARGRQLGFWGGETEASRRAARALARLQGLLGPEAVRKVSLQGGRGPADRAAAPPSGYSETGAGAPAPTAAPPPKSPPKGAGQRPGPSAAAANDGTTHAGTPPAGPATGSNTPPASRTPRAGAPPPAAKATERSTSPPSRTPKAAALPPAAVAMGAADPPAGRTPGGRATPEGRAAEGLAGSGAPSAGRASQARPEGAAEARPEGAPWPGRIPEPSPAIVHPDPLLAEVQDGQGGQVAVDGRGLLSADPSRLRIAEGPWVPIAAWAGPWPVDERWWDPHAHRRLARLQVTTDRGIAYLLKLAGGQWRVEATYD